MLIEQFKPALLIESVGRLIRISLKKNTCQSSVANIMLNHLQKPCAYPLSLAARRNTEFLNIVISPFPPMSDHPD